MHFAPAKCKVLLQDWSGSSPNLVLAGEPVEVVDKYIYLGSCISAGGLARKGTSLRIGKVRAAGVFRSTSAVPTRCQLVSAALRSILLYDSQI